MFVRKVLFKCDFDDCDVEHVVDTFNTDKTPAGWGRLEIRVDEGNKEIFGQQHYCPKHVALLAEFLSAKTGWHVNDCRVSESPLKPGANPQPCE